MVDHAAFLRGMNIGARRVTNDVLHAHLEAMGLGEVAVFRASGNVVFAAGDGEAEADLSARIEAGLGEALGYAVPVFLRSAAEVRAIAAHEPFPQDAIAASKGKLQVLILLEPPAAATRRRVLTLAPEDEPLAFGTRELYWLPSAGYLESNLDLKALAVLLGSQTHRTKGTIEHLAHKYFPA